MNNTPPTDSLDLDELTGSCVEMLEQLAALDEDALPESEVFEKLIAKIYKANRKRRRRKSGQARKANDKHLKLAAAEIRRSSRAEVSETPEKTASSPAQPIVAKLGAKANRCYACNEPYQQLHSFYHVLCPKCGDVSFAKRNQTADLSSRRAMVTGGRIKIGFQSALNLLRAGAEVHVTTRFPKEAAVRYSEQTDFEAWQDRLHIHKVDFRDLPGLLEFIETFSSQWPSLNILINNAAQSVKRSQAFHERLARFENLAALNSGQKKLIASSSSGKSTTGNAGLLEGKLAENLKTQTLSELAPMHLLRDDDDRFDTREKNSWSMRLSEVEPVELLEVLLVNSNAPALLVRGFRDLMCRSPFADRFIVNVSGADGTFALSKSGSHTHVNMSKAAMNMITRSCGREMARDGIYVNSVDTGWITHEGSYSYRQQRQKQGFVPPYDQIDGAARVLDPVFRFVHQQEVPFGTLFRNFKPAPW